MLVLVSLFLTTFLVAAIAVWSYRLIFGSKGLNRKMAARPDVAMTAKLETQKGFFTFAPRLRDKLLTPARPVKLHAAKGGLRAPWGW